MATQIVDRQDGQFASSSCSRSLTDIEPTLFMLSRPCTAPQVHRTIMMGVIRLLTRIAIGHSTAKDTAEW